MALDGVKWYCMQKLLTPRQVAEILQIDEETVRVYARKGILPSIKIGNKIRILPSNLDLFITASEYRPSDTNAGTNESFGRATDKADKNMQFDHSALGAKVVK